MYIIGNFIFLIVTNFGYVNLMYERREFRRQRKKYFEQKIAKEAKKKRWIPAFAGMTKMKERRVGRLTLEQAFNTGAKL